MLEYALNITDFDTINLSNTQLLAIEELEAMTVTDREDLVSNTKDKITSYLYNQLCKNKYLFDHIELEVLPVLAVYAKNDLDIANALLVCVSANAKHNDIVVNVDNVLNDIMPYVTLTKAGANKLLKTANNGNEYIKLAVYRDYKSLKKVPYPP